MDELKTFKKRDNLIDCLQATDLGAVYHTIHLYRHIGDTPTDFTDRHYEVDINYKGDTETWKFETYAEALLFYEKKIKYYTGRTP